MKENAKTMNLTEGRPLTQILLFALPLVGGTIFQQLYSFVDTVMVGRFVGVDALAGVGTTYSLNFLTLGFVQGACVGFGIPLAQSYGADDKKQMHRYYWNGGLLCVILAAVMTVLITLLAGPLLRMVHTPADIYGLALTYARVVFLGIPASVLYNYSAGALRAVGDSRHPLHFLILSSFVNIALDWLLMVPLKMGVAGAALATVASQLLSGVLCMWWLLAKTDLMRIAPEERKASWPHIKKLCIVGLPMGFEYSVSAIGAVVMQGAINSLGSVAVAAQTAGEKIRQMFTLPMESVGMAMATYAGQNYGAGRIDRVRQGIRSGLVIQAVYSAAAWAVLYFVKGPAVGFVLGETTSDVALGAVQYLTLISTLFIIHGSLMIFRNTLQGMGYSMHAILSGVGELIGRSVGGWLAVTGFGFVAICYANPLAWGLALCYCVVVTVWYLRRLEKEKGKGM